MPIQAVVALALAATFATLAAIHVYWALGGVTSGGGAVPTTPDGTPLMRPGRAITLAVACALGAAAVVVLARGGVLAAPWPVWMHRAGAWVLGAVFLLRAVGDFRYVGLFKRERGTRFARLDTRWYTPLCLLLAAGAFYLASS